MNMHDLTSFHNIIRRFVRSYMEQHKMKELQDRPAPETDAVGNPPDNQSIRILFKR